MNLLILSSHSILEYDDLRLFSRLGYDVFMPGGYSDPTQANQMRPAVPEAPHHPELAALVDEQRERHAGQPIDFGIVDWGKADLHPRLVEWADVIMVNCFPDTWIGNQWAAIREKRVIWRTIGQSDPRIEHEMRTFARQGLEVVRYSPAEKRAFEPLGVFAGEDAMIRFGKDAADYGPWLGDWPMVGNVTQNMDIRGDHCGLDFWLAATERLPTKPAGLGSERLSNGTGLQTWDELRRYLSHIRTILYTGTQPASYTLGFMEALLAGVPVVSIGPDEMWLPALLETHELAPWGSREAAREMLQHWLSLEPNDELLTYGSDWSRRRGQELFSYEAVGPQWLAYLGDPAADAIEPVPERRLVAA